MAGTLHSLDRTLPINEISKDILYQVTILTEIGRICNEFKFSANENPELEGKKNGKMYFNFKIDTTRASFVFNKL